ncbi:MAG: NAD(P)H-hydrate dehydratase [Bacteroidales bacterium]|nr:NAD(P)H-hydrate dehydratase [Bacteroidales bacterium]
MTERNQIELNPKFLRPRLLHRRDDSHKGDYGHLLIVAGCQTMPGAAVLATGAALKSGCGLVTLHSTDRALQAAVNQFPSAMLSEDPGRCFSVTPLPLSRYSALAVGPGLGQAPVTAAALADLMSDAREAGIPMVLDADALNLIAAAPGLRDLIPEGSILTPHPGELRRLIPDVTPDNESTLVSALSARTGSVVIVKGYRSRIYTPDGNTFINTTGNPGMAKGGSGDVLTGLVGGLLARGYSAVDATCLGAWIHGYAGDVLTEECTAEAYSSLDLIERLWAGFVRLYYPE